VAEREIVIPYSPRLPQLEIHEALAANRFVVVVAHRRMGKTVSAINQLVKSAIECNRERPRFAYIAPTYSQAKRVAFDYLMHYTRPLGAVANIAELRVDFWDRRIQLFGSENPDSLRGQYFDGVILDEIGDQNPKIWNEIIRPALADRAPESWALFIGTPKGQNHFKDLRDRAESEPGWKLLEFKASQTGIVNQDELNAAKREMGDEKYEQEFECSFSAAVEGSYYGKQVNDLESQNRFCQIARDDLLQTYCAWDLGMGDSTSIWVAQVMGKEIRLLDYIENHGQGLDWYVSELTNRGWHKAEMLLPHDVQVRELGTGRSRLEVLQEAGVSCTIVPRMPVADGIQAVRQLLPNCWFNTPATKQGVDCLRNYRRDYDEKRNVYFEKPMHDWASHGSDAFRYLATGMTDLSNWSKPLKVNTGWVV
jgi:phage terminase large subunit